MLKNIKEMKNDRFEMCNLQTKQTHRKEDSAENFICITTNR